MATPFCLRETCPVCLEHRWGSPEQRPGWRKTDAHSAWAVKAGDLLLAGCSVEAYLAHKATEPTEEWQPCERCGGTAEVTATTAEVRARILGATRWDNSEHLYKAWLLQLLDAVET
jgi:hypothetical protein